MKVDYIIVGLGLAGIAFAETLFKNHKTFVVFDNCSQQASIVAGGMYNSVTLKRYTPVWLAKEQLAVALPFYKSLEEKFNIKLDYKVQDARVLSSVEEQNNWFTASDKPALSNELSTELVTNNNKALKAPFKLGMLKNTGRIDTALLSKTYKKHLLDSGLLYEQSFKYAELVIKEDSVEYKTISARKIVFCEGFGMKKNPFFKDLPMQESKGELLIIKAPKLKIDFLAKGPVFVMPLGADLYKVGATFNWNDKTNLTTEAGKNELLVKLKSFVNTDFEINKQLAGVRPTVKDRKPLLGTHHQYKNIAIFNGLGTRGVMIAPYAAPFLFNHLEFQDDLPKELAISRF